MLPPQPAVATGSSSSSPLWLLLRRCCCWFTMTGIDIDLYYGGPLSNANASKGLPFEGPGIKRYCTQIDHRLKTLNDLKMRVMEELHVNLALDDIQIIFRSPHEVLNHQINYKYMAIEIDKHVKIMFDKMERIAQVSAIELYVKLELRAKVGAEEIQQTTTSLQVIVPDTQYESFTHVEDDDDDDEDYVDDAAINGEGFVDGGEYEERIDQGDFEIDIDNHEIATNVHANDKFDRGETDAENAISVLNITNTISALSFSANTRANMERRTIGQISSMDFLNNIEATSSSSTRQWKYDVFLSFRGGDTREGFTNYLYKALYDKGIHTFIDDKLQKGEEISEELIQAIKNSSILVVVFSENYAQSKWCLDELAEIVECSEKDQEVQIIPVFYNVDPSEIRNQRGNFGIALANHEEKFKNNKDKVQRWRDALRKAADTSGWPYKKGGATYKCESHFIQEIVNKISDAKLNQTPLYVDEYLVGINSRAGVIESLLDIGLDKVCIVGIYGLPGVGKTTIAKAVYNKIAKHFDGSSFLGNVREKLGTHDGIITLQEQLLNDILGDGNWKVGNRFRGINLIAKRLCCKKVFLILDDVDGSTRLDNLLGKYNWFAPGSRVIITLRDRSLLAAFKEKFCTTYKVKEFKVEQLNKHEALRLFKAHAFHGNIPCDEDYSRLATKFINFADGLPLALEIIAHDLCGKAKDEWESALDVYNEIPNKDIQNILRVSYNGLHDIEKSIFLDIAFFYKGWKKDDVVKILNASGLHPNFGIPRLVNKCLITVNEFGRLSMHDLIQQMGWEVVRQEAPDILEERSRLCHYKDSHEVLTTDKGSKKIRGIVLHSPRFVRVQLHIEALRRMENLKCLIVHNVHICIPIELKGLHNLTVLNLEGCSITNACLESISGLVALAVLNLDRCSLNDDGWEKFSGNKNLKVLSLGFNNVTDACLVHLKGLTNLESLNLDSCGIGDEGLANLTGLTLLKTLELPDTEVASNGPRHLSGLTNLENLDLSFTLVNDSSLKMLSGLTSLKSLNLDARQITDSGLASLTSLTGLTHLDLFGARISDSGTKCLQYFKNLQSLEICGGGLTDAGVMNIKDLASLRLLNLSQNGNLTDKTLELVSGLTALESLKVSDSCITREGLQYLKPLKNLRSLSLESCEVTASDIKNLQSDALPNLISFRPE